MINNIKQNEKYQLILNSLKQSVDEALFKKQLLGQYAVIAKNGKIIKLFIQKSDPLD